MACQDQGAAHRFGGDAQLGSILSGLQGGKQGHGSDLFQQRSLFSHDLDGVVGTVCVAALVAAKGKASRGHESVKDPFIGADALPVDDLVDGNIVCRRPPI